MATTTVRVPARTYRRARLKGHYRRYAQALPRNAERLVPGVGNPCSRLMFIGEAPGEIEDEQGVPFVGVSGALLNTMLSNIGIRREEVFITNLLKVRPPGNDVNAVIDEVPPAMTLMRWEIGIVTPKVIVPLGRWAAGVFFQNFSITDIAGGVYAKQGYTVVPMLHPSYVLRTRGQKGYTLHFQKLKTAIEEVGT